MYRYDSRLQGHDPNYQAAQHGDQRTLLRRPSFGTIAALCTIALLASWAGAATLYILFRDDALKLIAERQVSIARAYDAQIANLEAEIHRLKSLKLIDQERVDRAVADLARRQALIETRQSALIALGAKSDVRAPAAETTASVPTAAPATPPKPAPISDTILITPPTERVARLESRPLPPLGPRLDASRAETASELQIIEISRGLARIEAAQSRALNEAEEYYDSRAQRMRKVIADLGMNPVRDGARVGVRAASEAGVGGPFQAWTRAPEDPFARQLHRIRSAALAVEALEREIGTAPVRRPTAGDADVTSAFGMRMDPFLRQPAIHTGIDFRGDRGDPVHATAAGKVALAERNGGYGLMVEIDHGNGLATRYAHLAATTVAAGDRVAPAAVVGRIGSTGRSTAPHLHYEVRLNGEAVDPQRFLRAGLRLENP